MVKTLAKKEFIVLFLGVILISPMTSNSVALNAVKPSGLSSDLPTEIHLKLWGFETYYQSMRSNFLLDLPKVLSYESVNPSSSELSSYSILAANNWFQLYSSLNIVIDQVQPQISEFDSSHMANFTDSKTLNPVIASYKENGSVSIVEGVSFNYAQFEQSLQQYNDPSGYTIHVMNFSYIDSFANNTGQHHWFTLGTQQQLDPTTDMRGLGTVGKNGIFYDPSAFTPLYENETFSSVSGEISLMYNYILERITPIIEKLIIGSPLSINYISYSEHVQVASVVIYDQDSTSTKINETVYKIRNLQKASLVRLFGFTRFDFKELQLGLPNTTNIAAGGTLGQLFNPQGNSTKIVITNQFAEILKNNIRNTYYSGKFPYGYYYLIVSFLDNKGREFVMTTDQGVEQNYTNQYLGFGLINYQHLDQESIQSINYYDFRKPVLNMMGKMIGLPQLDGFLAQIQSPMSTGSNTIQWDHTYTQFEINSYANRFGKYFGLSAEYGMQGFRDEIYHSVWRWMDTSSFDKPELTLLQAQTLYYKGNYTGAANLNLQAYQQYIDARDGINTKIVSIYNGAFYFILVVTALMAFDILSSYLISKKEFEEEYGSVEVT